MKIEKLYIGTHGNFTYSKNVILFDLRQKNEVITEEQFPNSVIARHLWMDA